MNIYEFYDENNNNAFENDFFSFIGEDRYEGEMSEENYEASDILDSHSESQTYRTPKLVLSTTSRRKFDNFYYYLHSRGYNIMKSCEKFPHKVYVFELTNHEADMLMKKFYGKRRLTPKHSGYQAA